ncbi:hypothetical protein BDV96DRAFT_650541 [Lophiotrema nucula]|uniref:Uncharacterized protein n=1 Tax=Lophiotrema nucula TaxID=690887 RepID=A0A6A5YVB7_9PLEO|nr:hypothetical protein BDV96DRAFT_650541 [Lophiotrema nucula]
MIINSYLIYISILSGFILSFITPVSGQFNNSSGSASNEKQGWYSAPNYRGTSDILWSCLITVFLCCWTAIHPTIPAPNTTWTERCLDRILILFWGVVAPETLIVLAGNEWTVASEIVKSSSGRINGERWSLGQAFYAIMGGYATRVASNDDSEKVVPLDYKAFQTLLNDGRIDPSNLNSRTEIRDKGKADGLELYNIFL